MNNKTIMIIISAIIVVLLAVVLVWGVTSCGAESNEPVIVGGEENSSDASLESGESEESNIPGVADAPEEWFDEDYESEEENQSSGNGSSASTSSENNNNEDNSSSASSSSSSSSATSSKPSTNVNVSGGNGSSGSAGSSSAPSIEDAEEDGKVTYEEYMAMDGSEQKKYLESFESVEKFFVWFNAAKDQYEKEHPSIEIGNGSIDMNDIINGNP